MEAGGEERIRLTYSAQKHYNATVGGIIDAPLASHNDRNILALSSLLGIEEDKRNH